MDVTVTLKLEGSPDWMLGLVLEKTEDGRISICVMKNSGDDYGAAYVASDELIQIAKMLS